jgi:hypothetical protein
VSAVQSVRVFQRECPMTTITEPTTPHPPRYRWLKRIVRVAAVFTVLFVALMIFWRYEANRRLGREVQRLIDSGEPMSIEAFAAKPMPPELNAANTLRQAARLAGDQQEDPALKVVTSFDISKELDQATSTALGRVADICHDARALLRVARFQPRVEWDRNYFPPIIQSLSDSERYPFLSLVACGIAHYEHHAGNDAETIELLRDSLSLADRMQRFGMESNGRDRAFRCQTNTTTHVRVLSQNLAVSRDGATPAATQPTGPASAAQVRSLIAELLDERPLREGVVGYVAFERFARYETATILHLSLGPPTDGNLYDVGSHLVRPLFKLDALKKIQACSQLMNASSTTNVLSNFPAACNAIPIDHSMRGLLVDHNVQLALRHNVPDFLGLFDPYFRALTNRRAAAITLALRLYHVDHGEFPERLQDLVGTYLPTVPADPYAPEDQPFAYRRSPLLLYSVGRNGRDDGGNITVPADAPRDQNRTVSPWYRLDLVFAIPIHKAATTAPNSTG